MSITVGVNGELVPYPEAGETGWGPDGTEFAVAVSQALTKLGLGGSTTPKAILNIVSTTAGVLVPRMTTAQRDAMFPVPDASYRGLMIFNLDVDFYQIYDGTAWISPTSIMAMTANTIPVADGTGNALVNSPMTVSGTKVTQAGAMDITGIAGLLGGANLNNLRINNLLAGTAGTDAVNKAQLDAVALTVPIANTLLLDSGTQAGPGSRDTALPVAGTYLCWYMGESNAGIGISGSVSNVKSFVYSPTTIIFFIATGTITITLGGGSSNVYTIFGIRVS